MEFKFARLPRGANFNPSRTDSCQAVLYKLLSGKPAYPEKDAKAYAKSAKWQLASVSPPSNA